MISTKLPKLFEVLPEAKEFLIKHSNQYPQYDYYVYDAYMSDSIELFISHRTSPACTRLSFYADSTLFSELVDYLPQATKYLESIIRV